MDKAQIGNATLLRNWTDIILQWSFTHSNVDFKIDFQFKKYLIIKFNHIRMHQF